MTAVRRSIERIAKRAVLRLASELLSKRVVEYGQRRRIQNNKADKERRHYRKEYERAFHNFDFTPFKTFSNRFPARTSAFLIFHFSFLIEP